MSDLIKVSDETELFPKYKNTPVEQLFKYHNFDYSEGGPAKAQMLVGMCMDNRNQLKIPNNFAYILRTGGGNMRSIEFKISYAIALGGVKCVALIGHNHCGMTNLVAKRKEFIQGMVNNAGWTEKQADEHFMSFAPIFEIENEIKFLISETQRLRERYPKVLIAPLFYKIEDHLLYLLKTDNDVIS